MIPTTVSEDRGAHLVFDRAEWRALRAGTPLTLSEAELAALCGLNECVSATEVEEVYLPLSRLLNLHVTAARNLGIVTDSFLERVTAPPPYVLGVAGGVAVGKSTFCRILQAVLARWPDHPRVDLVSTDAFLYPNQILEERGLMMRKGFPESYDLRRMIAFLTSVKSGEPEIEVPFYSHMLYDIVPGKRQIIRSPDILIFEGLNVLQTSSGAARVVASDFFDFSAYLDGDEDDVEEWYVERFLILQGTAFQDPTSYFRRYRNLLPEEARNVARSIYREINLVNLRENIQPTRRRARLVLRKRSDHSVGEIWLRRM